MPRDAIAKVLEIESTLEPGSKEASEGGDQGGKDGHHESMDLERGPGDRRNMKRRDKGLNWLGCDECPPDECRVGVALDTRPSIDTKISCRADHVIVTHKERGPLRRITCSDIVL